MLDGKSPPFGVRRCDRCRIGYSTPAMTDQELANSYPEDYESFTPRRALMRRLQALKYLQDLSILRRVHTGRGRSVFEIGAGRGEFLELLRRHGYRVAGLEPGTAGRSYARERWRIDLQQGYAAELHFTEPYDIVVARHVLEHLNTPREVLENVYEHGLRPGGYLFLKLPKLDSWECACFGPFWSGLDLPRHRVHFEERGIRSLLQDIGYQEVQIRTEIVPSDLRRSCRYVSAHGEAGVKRAVSRAFGALPEGIQLGLCQLLGIGMFPLGAGRMIVTARR